MLMVSPRKMRIITDVRMDSGREDGNDQGTAAISQEEQNHQPVRHAAMTPCTEPHNVEEPRTKMELVGKRPKSSAQGKGRSAPVGGGGEQHGEAGCECP